MSKKTKTAFVCDQCGADYPRWNGQCASCGEWNTIKEVRLAPAALEKHPSSSGYAGNRSEVKRLSEVNLSQAERISSGISEFDRVLGGGIVRGSVVLIGGAPGAGKSTLLLQAIANIAARDISVLYVSGEESLQQIAERANRLKLPADKILMLAETSVERICDVLNDIAPQMLVIDSIQVMYAPHCESAAGSVSQVRECAAFLIQYAKQTGTAMFFVGHVTKDGNLAGPKVLEHMIDCFLMLDGDDNRYRTLRGHKNRFGAVNELGIFAMTETGLKEVKNPSAIFLARTEEISPGSLVTVLWEGTRPLLVEIQALVDGSQLGNPRRIAVGLDHNRMAMLLAVLHRHGGLFMADQDVFVNVVGGVKVNETSADLTLLLAIVSSFKDKVLPRELVVFGEVGLAGEIRPVPSGQERLQEAAKHGFTRAIVPKANAPRHNIAGMQVIAVSKLSEALGALW
jgi:DNA repair protein RadA/Sms